MDLLDLIILALRLLLVALLYLFLVLVMRSAARGLRRPVTTPARSPVAPQLRLIVLEPGIGGMPPGETIAVHDGSTLGRSSRADVVVGDSTVSAEHAHLSRVGRAWVVTDLGSTNGTRVNDLSVTGSAPLADGDVLTLGGVRLQVHVR
jgi:hypothetical protein